MGKITMELPCKVGDSVLAYLSDAPKRGRTYIDLTDCILERITMERGWKEPLFTAICKEKALCDNFWLSDFGKTIFTMEQYFRLLDKVAAKRRKQEIMEMLD